MSHPMQTRYPADLVTLSTHVCSVTLFQQQVINVSFASRWLGTGFHTWVVQAPEQTNMVTCHVFEAARHSFRLVGNCALEIHEP
jgi:hypothetical protein